MAEILTRSFALVAVRKDASGAVAAPEQSAGPKKFKFRANDANFDRYNDRNKVAGWKLDNFNANPVILFNHDDGSGGMFAPPTPTLPIGKGFAYVESDALMVDIEFDQDDEFARKVQSKVEKGILNAVSVRYRLSPGKFRENERGGIDSDEQELFEISVVNLPGHQGALRVKSAEDRESDLVERIARRTVELLKSAAPQAAAEPAEELAPEPTVVSEPPAPAEEPAAVPADSEEPAQSAPALDLTSEAAKSCLADAVLKFLKEKRTHAG